MSEIAGQGTGIMVGLPPPRKHSLICFYNDDGTKAGELWYNEDRGLCFDGNMDESARLLCEQLKPHIDEYIRPEIESGPL